jgi:hypothetical protein
MLLGDLVIAFRRVTGDGPMFVAESTTTESVLRIPVVVIKLNETPMTGLG